MATKRSPKTLQEAVLYYADADRCQAALVAARWPDGVICPHCGSKDVGYLANQRRWQCKGKHPRRQFSAKVGTIFEDSPISLSTWFVAIWLIASAKNGISSYEIMRSVGVTQKTAWFMLHRIRLAMQTASFEKKMTGDIEADETYVGGKFRNMHKTKRESFRGSRWGGKVAVFGLLERNSAGSKVRTHVVKGVKRNELRAVINEHVEPQSNVYTDALPSYHSLNDQYQHEFVDHVEGYVRGNVHTNGLESFWAMLKRTLGGTYISVEPFHLSRYVDEQAYRFNSRKMSDADRFKEMTGRVVGKRITYAELTEKPQRQSA
jgi:transposase-like protein